MNRREALVYGILISLVIIGLLFLPLCTDLFARELPGPEYRPMMKDCKKQGMSHRVITNINDLPTAIICIEE